MRGGWRAIRPDSWGGKGGTGRRYLVRECLEDPPVPRPDVGCEVLGMPLDRQYPPLRVGRFHTLDHAVWRRGRHTQSRPQAAGRLMVVRVHSHLHRTGSGREPRAGDYGDVVRARRPVVWLVVLDVRRPLARQVLIERSAAGNVDHLDSTADPEDRELPFARGIE